MAPPLTGLEGIIAECRANAAAWRIADEIAATSGGQCLDDTPRTRVTRLAAFEALRRAGSLPEPVALVLELRAAAATAGLPWSDDDPAGSFGTIVSDARDRAALASVLDAAGAETIAASCSSSPDAVERTLRDAPSPALLTDQVIVRYLLTRGTGFWPRDLFAPFSPRP